MRILMLRRMQLQMPMQMPMLRPLKKYPLRAGKVDLAPVLAIALIFFAAEGAERGLAFLYAHLPF